MIDVMAVIERVKSGSTEAFADLVSAYQANLFTFLLRLSGNRWDAEELLQDTLVKVYRNLFRYDRRASFRTWIYSIALNTFRTYKRRKRLNAVNYDELDTLFQSSDLKPDQSPELLLEAKEGARAILHLLSFLKADQRAALTLKYLQGFSHAEIGQVLGISEAAAKMKVYRARKEILSRYEKYKGW